MIVDYHMHLRAPDESLEHTVEAIERFVDVAAARGVDEIGFTEHVYYFTVTRDLWTVPYHAERCVYAIEPYVDAVAEAQRRGLPVKLGLEVDYVRGREDDTRAMLAPYPWDYLLGSVHFIGPHAIDGEPKLTDAIGVDDAWHLYFDHLAAAARSGLFNSLAHPDLVKIFGERPDDETRRRLYGELVDAMRGTGVCLEVSTAGLHKPVGELYPDPELLALANAAEIPITLASDAHVPEFVGRDFGRGIARARAGGYETVTVFERRSARQEPLG